MPAESALDVPPWSSHVFPLASASDAPSDHDSRKWKIDSPEAKEKKALTRKLTTSDVQPQEVSL